MMPMTPAMADAIIVLASGELVRREASEHAGNLVLRRSRVASPKRVPPEQPGEHEPDRNDDAGIRTGSPGTAR